MRSGRCTLAQSVFPHMIQKLTCRLPQVTANYTIAIGSGQLLDAKELKSDLEKLGSRFALITDENVAALHGIQLTDALNAHGLDVSLFSFPPGETSKSRRTKEQLEDSLLENGFGRDACILALGGGVVTDLAGYVAATYCRGIPLVMIPTTLLAMVDASIGGKTSVNTPQGKNLVGCIYQPKKVIIDTAVLSSLPLPEVKNGVVEIIKHAMLADSGLFHLLEEHADLVLSSDPVILQKVIVESCRIKNDIVKQDEKENGKRRLLNLGHTVGHALETVTHYVIAHGEAVAIGLVVECRLAWQLGHLSLESFQRIHAILKKYALALKLPENLSIPSLLNAMKLDKKARNGKPRFVILADIGSPLPCGGDYCTSVDEQLLREAFQWMEETCSSG